MPRTPIPVMTVSAECAVARSCLLHARSLHRNAAHAGKYAPTCQVCTMLTDVVVLVDDLCKHPVVQEEACP